MPEQPQRNIVTARESGIGPFGQYINVGHHLLGADEPGLHGGCNTGPDPFELVMAGLAACTTMTIRMVASRRKLPLRDVQVEVRHLRAPPPGGTAAAAPAGQKPHAFERLVTLEGELDEEQRRMLVGIADRCPVHRLLAGEAEIITREAARAA